MGHESRIEPWSPHLTAFCFAGIGTDRLRREEAMKTAGRENPNRRANVSSNRAPGADGQNKSCSIQWAAKQEKFRPTEMCFFLTSPFIELIRTQPRGPTISSTASATEVAHRDWLTFACPRGRFEKSSMPLNQGP